MRTPTKAMCSSGGTFKVGIASQIAERYAVPLIDRSLDQRSLNLSNRSRTSLFPWRGQFSPELVELLLSDLPSEGWVIDPFVGSGTSLFEAGHHGMNAVGAEINPAALSFAVMSELTSKPPSHRADVARLASDAVCHVLSADTCIGGLFGEERDDRLDDALAVQILSELEWQQDSADLFRAALILSMGHGALVNLDRVRSELHKLSLLIENYPETAGRRIAIAADARMLPLEDEFASSAITSPPYINVFNYHQQYRPAAELMGAGALQVARAEIGANRKHRQNRFLTVVQYSLDMADALRELWRVLRENAIAKVVIGRESNVRGVPFRNAQLLAALAEGCGGFSIDCWQERSFTSRFGAFIYEDILTLRRLPGFGPVVGFEPRDVGAWALEQALEAHSDPDIRNDIEAALAGWDQVPPSPLFQPSSVPWMASRDPWPLDLAF